MNYFEQNRRNLTVFLDIEKHISYETSYNLVGLNIKRKPSTWLLIVSVEGANGNRLVTFIESNSIGNCVELLCTALRSTGVTLKWHKDKFNS